MEKDTLYYDGACPLCRAEIDKLSGFARDHLVLKNIHELEPDETLPDRHKLLSRLHLKTAEGTWITGLRANIRAWRHTPFRYLWQILDWPLIRPISHCCYEFWLRKRQSNFENNS